MLWTDVLVCSFFLQQLCVSVKLAVSSSVQQPTAVTTPGTVLGTANANLSSHKVPYLVEPPESRNPTFVISVQDTPFETEMRPANHDEGTRDVPDLQKHDNGVAQQETEHKHKDSVAPSTTSRLSTPSRWRQAISLQRSIQDGVILKTALPAMMNLAVVPAVLAVETMWIGRFLAQSDSVVLAGHSAANSAYLTWFYLIQFLPTMAAPTIATAMGHGMISQARKHVCETMTQSLVLGFIGTIFLIAYPEKGLGLILKSDSAAMRIAAPYLRLRALSMMWELLSATGVAGFRGLLDTVTPLNISVGSRLVKLILDPVLMRGTPLGLFGAALSTLVAEGMSGFLFWRSLVRRQLLHLKEVLRWPQMASLKPLLTSGTTMLARQVAINVAMISSARVAQTLDPSGVSGAVYGIVNQIYTVGFVVHVAMQGAAAALVPSTVAKKSVEEGRRMADRIFAWGALTGMFIALIQGLLLHILLPIFTPLSEVQEAARIPAMLSCVMHVVNGPRFVGEGVLMGLKSFRDLTMITIGGVAGLVFALVFTPLGHSLSGVMLANILFGVYQATALLVHYIFVGGLSSRPPKAFTGSTHLKQV